MVNSIEINGSFYSLQRPSSYQAWQYYARPIFVFHSKAARIITHIRRLRDVGRNFAELFRLLGVWRHEKEKLGPILWQFPPTMIFDAEKFGAILRDVAA